MYSLELTLNSFHQHLVHDILVLVRNSAADNAFCLLDGLFKFLGCFFFHAKSP